MRERIGCGELRNCARRQRSKLLRASPLPLSGRGARVHYLFFVHHVKIQSLPLSPWLLFNALHFENYKSI
jgi:hypothetical protein